MATGIQEIDCLSKDVTELKVSVARMEPYVQQIPKIADSLSTLAEIMPRLEANLEDHKRIHRRLDDIEHGVEKEMGPFSQRLRGIELAHAKFNERHKIEDEHEAESTFKLIRKAAVPILVAVILGFTGWLLLTHIPDYIHYIKAKQVRGTFK